jgi:hypothetical protein
MSSMLHVRSVILGASAALATVILSACSGTHNNLGDRLSAPASTAAARILVRQPTACATQQRHSVQQVDTAGYRMVLAVGDREAIHQDGSTPRPR